MAVQFLKKKQNKILNYITKEEKLGRWKFLFHCRDFPFSLSLSDFLQSASRSWKLNNDRGSSTVTQQAGFKVVMLAFPLVRHVESHPS